MRPWSNGTPTRPDALTVTPLARLVTRPAALIIGCEIEYGRTRVLWTVARASTATTAIRVEGSPWRLESQDFADFTIPQSSGAQQEAPALGHGQQAYGFSQPAELFLCPLWCGFIRDGGDANIEWLTETPMIAIRVVSGLIVKTERVGARGRRSPGNLVTDLNYYSLV